MVFCFIRYPIPVLPAAVASAVYALVIFFGQDPTAVGFVFYAIAVLDRSVLGNLTGSVHYIVLIAVSVRNGEDFVFAAGICLLQFPHII